MNDGAPLKSIKHPDHTPAWLRFLRKITFYYYWKRPKFSEEALEEADFATKAQVDAMTAQKRIAKWRYYLPSIRFSLRIPFISIETHVIYERPEMFGVEWYGLDVQIWKYHFRFALYWKPKM